jgi:hypothetical protein
VRNLQYKPEWAYKTPAGFRDELFIVPFHFVIPGDGRPVIQRPWQLDDDVPFIIRGIVFPEIGLNNLSHEFNANGRPGLVRIRDTQGNPLSENPLYDGRILSLGAWGQSGFDGRNAFGFPIDPEIECAPGGAVLFDFQISTNAGIASAQHSDAAETIEFDASIYGTAGNAFTIELRNPGANNIPLSVAVVGGAVTVTLATDGGGAITSTYVQVEQIINTSAAARAVLSAKLSGPTPDQVITAMGITNLAGGSASTPITLDGSLIGVKRFKEC